MEDINRIKLVLVEKKRTARWLSEEMGVNPSTVSKWCTNSSQPDLGSLLKIARGGLMATIKREKFMLHIEKPGNIRFIKDFLKERGLELTERQQEILHLLREDPGLTSQKISHKNAVTPRTIIKDMNYLQENRPSEKSRLKERRSLGDYNSR